VRTFAAPVIAITRQPAFRILLRDDHRVVDGIHAAEFVQVIRGYLETPATLFVE